MVQKIIKIVCHRKVHIFILLVIVIPTTFFLNMSLERSTEEVDFRLSTESTPSISTIEMKTQLQSQTLQQSPSRIRPKLKLRKLNNINITPELYRTQAQAALKELSHEFQLKLNSVQNPPSCSNISQALLCSHTSSGKRQIYFSDEFNQLYEIESGIGVHIQHRIGCLMMSLALNIPLIHDEFSYWTFEEPWSKYFKPIGSSCPLTEVKRLIHYDWVSRNFSEINVTEFLAQGRNSENTTKSYLDIEFPLTNGILVPKSIALRVEKYHKNPYLWFIGQFCKAVFQLQDEILSIIEETKRRFFKISKNDSQQPVFIGIHARRTDKVGETKGIFVTVENFMESVSSYLDQIQWNASRPLGIFIATEDCHVVSEFHTKFPQFESNFVSFCEATRPNFESRKGNLLEIIRDMSILIDCDYVICSFSSNVGRVVLEVKSWREPIDPDPERGIKSLHKAFSLDFYWNPVKQQRLVYV